MKHYLSVVILFLSFSACSTYENMYLDILVPAKHSLQPEIKSVVLIDNASVWREKRVHTVILPNRRFTVDTIWKDDFATVALEGLKYELDQRHFFDSVYVHKIPIKRSGLNEGNTIPWALINELCNKYNVEAVVSIDDYFYRTKIKVEESYEDDLYGALDARGALFWRVYNNIDQTMLFKEIQTDTISWEAIGSSINSIGKNLPGIKLSLEELANYMGETAANSLAPYWETQTRGFYISGSYEFMQAAELVRKEEWGEAIKLWKYAVDRSNNKTKAKAAYNLAIASEVLGDYKSAQYWISKSGDILAAYNSNQVNMDKLRIAKYAAYLKKRLVVIDQLKVQVGGFE